MPHEQCRNLHCSSVYGAVQNTNHQSQLQAPACWIWVKDLLPTDCTDLKGPKQGLPCFHVLIPWAVPFRIYLLLQYPPHGCRMPYARIKILKLPFSWDSSYLEAAESLLIPHHVGHVIASLCHLYLLLGCSCSKLWHFPEHSLNCQHPVYHTTWKVLGDSTRGHYWNTPRTAKDGVSSSFCCYSSVEIGVAERGILLKYKDAKI